MSKKSKDKLEESCDITDIQETLQKTYGNIVSSGIDLLNSSQEIISVSPKIDLILNGGIPEGTTTFVSGREKSGKTTMLLRICAQAQKQDRDIWYLDVEHRLKKMNLEGTVGLDLNKFNHVRSIPGNILNAEKVLTIAKQILTDIPRSVVIIDSFGALVTEGELIGELKGTQRNDLHKLLSLFHRQLAPIVSINKNLLFGVQHIYSNTGGGYTPWSEGGSSKGRYLSDIKLRVKSFQQFPKDSNKKLGQTIEWICDYSALGPPGNTCESSIRYGIGVDILQELIDLGTDAGLIIKAGSWFKCQFIKETEPVQFQGEEKLYQGILDHPGWQILLEEELKRILA